MSILLTILALVAIVTAYIVGFNMGRNDGFIDGLNAGTENFKRHARNSNHSKEFKDVVEKAFGNIDLK